MLRTTILITLLAGGVAFAAVRIAQSTATESSAETAAAPSCCAGGVPACAFPEASASETLTASVVTGAAGLAQDDAKPEKDAQEEKSSEKEDDDAEKGEKNGEPEGGDQDGKKKPKKTYPEPDPEMGHIAGRITLATKLEDVELAPFVVDTGNRDFGFCQAHVKDQRLIVGPTREIKNVVVALQNYRAPAGTRVRREDFVLDNKGCLFEPHVGATTCRSKLILKNSDPFVHNSRGVLDMNFNKAIPPNGTVEEKMPAKESYVIVKCDFHPWMESRIHIFPHEHFDVTDETGTFRLMNIPPGTYNVEIRHELLCNKFIPVVRKDIVVEKGKTFELDVELEAPKKN